MKGWGEGGWEVKELRKGGWDSEGIKKGWLDLNCAGNYGCSTHIYLYRYLMLRLRKKQRS